MLCAETVVTMRRIALKLIVLVFLLHIVPLRAAESEVGATDKVYQDYTEAYQKAAQNYERAAKESQNSSYVSYAILGAFLLVALTVAAKTRRAQMAYSERAIQINLANQKLLEEIRDLLKRGHT